MRYSRRLGIAAAALVAMACGRCGAPQQPRVEPAPQREGTTAAGTPSGTVNTGEAGKGSQNPEPLDPTRAGEAQGGGATQDGASGTGR